MTKRFISLLLMTLILGSCAPAPVSLTPPPTATLPPTRTPRPAQTTVPTATPYPPLQTDGPYLLYTDGYNSLTMMDANGMGRKDIQIPQSTYIPRLEKAVSPNGEWLAYFTGSAEQPYDLALNILNISNGIVHQITQLIANGFPENLEPVTETIYFTENDTECSNDPKCKLRIVQSSFSEGMWRSIDWSLDSQSLAFAAQIDGPSSDVYIFNIENQSIRRLTNELENIGSIDWSPNGEKILYRDHAPGTVYSLIYIRIADPEIQSIQTPRQIDGGLSLHEGGWIDENSYIIWSGGEGAPPHNFRYINIENQQVKEIWEYSTEDFFIDKENKK